MAAKKKAPVLSDYWTAGEASTYLSEKFGRVISNKYIRRLSIRALHPIRAIESGNRWLYLKEDVENVEIRQRSDNAETEEKQRS